MVCFVEEAQKDTAGTIAKSSYVPPASSQKAIAIDSIPVSSGASQRDGSHDVLTVFENGDVISLSPDLEVVQWVANTTALAPTRDQGLCIEYASLNNARAVANGLLRGREDIIAVLNPSLDSSSELLDLSHVLCVVARRADNSRTLSLYQIQSRSLALPSTRLQPMKHLVTWDLPTALSVAPPGSTSRNYSLHAGSGILHLLTDRGLVSYDFSGAVPKTSSELGLMAFDMQSFLRIAPDLVFTTSKRQARILDAKYGTIQAEIELESSWDTAKEMKKRKHDERTSASGLSNPPMLISFYADLGLAVGIWNNELVGLQLGKSVTRKRARTQGVRLIDSLGKGINPADETSVSTSGREDYDQEKWQERKAKLDKYASKGKISEFEKLIAKDLDIKLEAGANGTDQTPKRSLTNGTPDAATTNGVHRNVSSPPTSAPLQVGDVDPEELPRKWSLPKSAASGSRLQWERYASYALSRIFRWIDLPSSEGPRGYLKIEFFPPNVFQWLLRLGHLTKESICRAILNESSGGLGLSAPVRDGHIVRALVDFDPDLHILSAVLNDNHFLPIGEVVQAIMLLIQGFDDKPKTDITTQLLTNGTEPSVDAMDVDFASELEAASNEIDRALSMLDNGLVIRGITLRPALVRLHAFPAPLISSALRSMLPRRDLESLMRLLHHEFKNGGWTSPYEFADSQMPQNGPDAEDTDNSAVAIIASLLSCTLDAISPTTWLTGIGGSTSGDSAEELIVDLLEDTSIALNGFWEATYIRGLISELLRYASKLPESQKPTKKALENQGKPFALDPKSEESAMLPLGSKPDLGIDTTKPGKGGKRRERSAREMGMLISKRVPKYSFERIVI